MVSDLAEAMATIPHWSILGTNYFGYYMGNRNSLKVRSKMPSWNTPSRARLLQARVTQRTVPRPLLRAADQRRG